MCSNIIRCSQICTDTYLSMFSAMIRYSLIYARIYYQVYSCIPYILKYSQLLLRCSQIFPEIPGYIQISDIFRYSQMFSYITKYSQVFSPIHIYTDIPRYMLRYIQRYPYIYIYIYYQICSRI